jgi:hypothetical protein
MRHLARAILASVVLPAVGAAIAYFVSNRSVWVAIITGLIAVALGLLVSFVAFSKQLIEPVKLFLESRKLYWEGHEKKRNVEDRDRRIAPPTDAEIRKYGVQYREFDKDLLSGYRKETESLPRTPVAGDQDSEDSRGNDS